MSLVPTAFLDRDGTLIVEPGADADPPFQVTPDDVRPVPGVIAALLRFQAAGLRLVVVTNQDGLGTDANPQDTFDDVEQRLAEWLGAAGVTLDRVLVCPHAPADGCDCRKPGTALVDGLDFDAGASFMVGDRDTDLAFADALGVPGYRIGPDGWNDVAAEALAALPTARRARVERRTAETQIELTLDLDGTGRMTGGTGIGFFDHLLTLIAAHARLDLRLDVTGDLHVDDHHTVEDVGLALGDALDRALGDRGGIARYGSASIPMDEVLCLAAVDLGGRFAFETDFAPQRDALGGLSLENVAHFFESMCGRGRLALHLRLLEPGRNEHHRVEAMAKAFAHALRAATRVDATLGGSPLSTKGTLSQ